LLLLSVGGVLGALLIALGLFLYCRRKGKNEDAFDETMFDPDRGRPIDHNGDTDMAAAPTVEPYVYNDGSNEMSEANAYNNRSSGYGSPSGYNPVPNAAGYGAAGAAAGAGAGYYGAQALSPHDGPASSTSGAGMTRGPSSASAYSNSTAYSGGAAGLGAGAAGMTAGAAKRQEAQRERHRMHLNGPGDVDEDGGASVGGGSRPNSMVGPEGLVQHQDGGRVLPQVPEPVTEELPPTYGSIPADK
jgi:hypothetical protein